MADTTFVDNQTVIVAAWLNDVNDLTYSKTFPAGEVAITNTGNQTFGGNLILPSGNGIDFSATSDAAGATSELFDDYEEGTWTPTIQGATVNPTQSYAAQSGWYIKTGKMIMVG